MSTHDDGGPAFPRLARSKHNTYDNCEEHTTVGGMTLRDYFAAKAMQAQVITDMVPGEACEALTQAAEEAGEDPVYWLALNSYRVADAMLLARKERAK